MKHTLAGSTFVAGVFAAAISLPLFAADGLNVGETTWEQVCAVANNRELTLTTGKGETIQGYCVSIDVNKIAVRTPDQRIIHVTRSTLSKLQVERRKGHQLAALGRGVRAGLRNGVDGMLSPWGPFAAILIPGTLAWGGVSAPFCILADVVADAAGKREIKVQP